MQHGLLIEGGIHHLDQLRNLCGADCQTIAGWDWNPGHVRSETAAWRSSDAFDGEACALFVLRMTNGSFASYEGNNLESGKTNSWYGEYYRLKCEGGAAVLDRDHGSGVRRGRGKPARCRRPRSSGRATRQSRPSSSTGSMAVSHRRRRFPTICNRPRCSSPPFAPQRLGRPSTFRSWGDAGVMTPSRRG
jgi:predicted dehydrogenase